MTFNKYQWHKQLMQDHTVKPMERLALLAVFDFSKGDGTGAIAGVQRIMEWTGLSRATVERALKVGRERGWLNQTYKGRRGAPGAQNRASVYSLTFPPTTPQERGVVEDEIPLKPSENTPHAEQEYPSDEHGIPLTPEAPTYPVTTDPVTTDPKDSKLNQVASPSYVSSGDEYGDEDMPSWLLNASSPYEECPF